MIDALPVACAQITPVPFVVGDPDNPGTLAPSLIAAYAGGARRIVIRPGVYVLPPKDGPTFNLDSWSNVVISAYDTKLILSKDGWGNGLWALNNCNNVSIEGGTVSQTVITSYQGRIVGMGTDPTGNTYFDWTPDAGYPVPPAGASEWLGSAIDTVDQTTRFLKVGCSDVSDAPISQVGPDTYRLICKYGAATAAVGDWFVSRYRDAPFKFHLSNSRNCTIKDITMMRNGFANIREDGIGGGNRIIHDTWALGPKPDGAIEAPLVTNAADGLHSTGANPGPDIENCDFQGVLLDDCIAIHGYFNDVVSGGPNTFTIKSNDASGFKIGDSLRFSDQKGFYADAIATSLVDNNDGTSTVTVDHVINVPSGAKFSDSKEDGPGCKILNNHIGGTRSRGILLKGDDGLIEGNTFSNIGMSAVSLGPEYYWGESNYVHNVVIRNNFFDRCGLFGSGGASVLVHGDGAIGNQNISILNNHFVDDLQDNIDINWASGVTISGNSFRGKLPVPPGIQQPSVISVADSNSITITNNKVINPPAFKANTVNVGKTMTGLTD